MKKEIDERFRKIEDMLSLALNLRSPGPGSVDIDQNSIDLIG